MLYDYECKSCKTLFSKSLKLSDRLVPVREPCPVCNNTGHIHQVILGAPAIGDSVKLGLIKPDSGFKEVLQKIHEKTPGSKLKSNSNLTSI